MDPLTVTLAGFKAVESIFNFLCTPVGQRQAAVWIDDQEKFRRDWAAIEGWFRATLKLGPATAPPKPVP